MTVITTPSKLNRWLGLVWWVFVALGVAALIAMAFIAGLLQEAH